MRQRKKEKEFLGEGIQDRTEGDDQMSKRRRERGH